MTLDLTRTGLAVAPDLLGAYLRSSFGGERVTVRITEVEAYEGERDPASHAFRGKTARNHVMFGPAGSVYVYRHMGLHFCMNITCGETGRASAVLLRAGEVIDGHEVAWQRRNAAGVCRTPRDLARGPARLTVALGVSGEHNGVRVNGCQGLDLTRAGTRPAFLTGPRVGVRGPGADPDAYPWRFWIEGDEFVSG